MPFSRDAQNLARTRERLVDMPGEGSLPAVKHAVIDVIETVIHLDDWVDKEGRPTFRHCGDQLRKLEMEQSRLGERILELTRLREPDPGEGLKGVIQPFRPIIWLVVGAIVAQGGLDGLIAILDLIGFGRG